MSTEQHTEQPEHVDEPGPFDRFIDDFASKNLESRAHSTARSLLGLLAFTAIILGIAITRDFSLTWHGAAHPEQRNGIVVLELDKSFARFASASPEVTCQPGSLPVIEPYRVLKTETTAQNLLITVQSVSGVSDPESTDLSCHVVLERKSYWSLLMEKGGE